MDPVPSSMIVYGNRLSEKDVASIKAKIEKLYPKSNVTISMSGNKK